jgi:hypothetical protein
LISLIFGEEIMSTETQQIVTLEGQLCAANPLLDSLAVPTILSARGLLDTGKIRREDSFWELPLTSRLLGLSDLLRFFMATVPEAQFFQRLVIAIHASYERRNPNDPAIYRELLEQGQRLADTRVRPLAMPTAKADMSLLVGPRGSGLSSLMTRISTCLGSDPKPLQLAGRNGGLVRHIPSLRIQWPPCGSEVALGRALLAEIDARFDGSYLSASFGKNYSKESALPRAQMLASLVSLGVLLVDNAKFDLFNTSACITLLPVLERFSAQTGIPVVIAADIDSFELMQERFGNLLSAAGSHFSMIEPSPDCDAATKDYVAACWAMRVSHPAEPMPDWLPFLAHEVTGARFKPLTTLMVELFRGMANRPKDTLTEDFVRQIAQKSIAPYLVSAARSARSGRSISGQSDAATSPPADR